MVQDTIHDPYVPVGFYQQREFLENRITIGNWVLLQESYFTLLDSIRVPYLYGGKDPCVLTEGPPY